MKWDEAVELAATIRARTDWWVADISGDGSLVGEDRYRVDVCKPPNMSLRLTLCEPFERVRARLTYAERGYTWPAQAQSAEQFREDVVRAYLARDVRCQCGAQDEDDKYLLPIHHFANCPFEWLSRADLLRRSTGAE